MQKLPSLAQKMALGSRLGFDPAIVPILAKGRAEFERMASAAQKANPFGDKDYENALKTEEGFKRAGSAVQRLRDRLAVGLFPTVNNLLKKFTAWVSDEKNIAKLRDAINKVVEVVGELARNLDKILAVFAVIYAHKYGMMFLEWGTKIVGVVSALRKGATAAARLSTGFRAIQDVLTAGILGLLLLVAEDLWVFHRGGTSVTGWMLTKFPRAVDAMVLALDVLGAAFLALSLSSGPVGVFAFAIGGIIIGAMALKDAWNPVMQWFGEAWDLLADKVASFVNTMDYPLRVVAKLLGVDLSMNENHGATRNAAFNVEHGSEQRHRQEVYQRGALGAGGMLPGMGAFGAMVPSLGIGRFSTPVAQGNNVTTMGDLHFHIDGSKMGPGDSEKLFREFSAKLEARGIGQGRDSARVKARNGQGGAH
jgi:predicted nucleotidyltransferase